MEELKKIIEASIQVKQQLLQDEVLLKNLQAAIDACVASFTGGGKVNFCGNGGSAADAQHLAAEFTGRFYKNRRALASEALHTNTSYLTAVANDYSFDEVYARLVEGTMQQGDVLVCLSTSGNSPNIVKACEAAKRKSIFTIGLTGASGGIMNDICNLCLRVPSRDTPRIQECHILLGHMICQIVEEKIFG